VIDMNRNVLTICATAVLCTALLVVGFGRPGGEATAAPEEQPNRLVVLWTADNPDVATHMAFMYMRASKTSNWWDDVTLVVWGPSSKLLAESEKLQSELAKLKEADVRVQACVVCANMYGVADTLRDLGIEVKPMGKPLSDMLQSDWTLISL
jgi:hypothetical protein